ncbi:hypothetical protein ACLOJK_002813 [Asimina triloba]
MSAMILLLLLEEVIDDEADAAHFTVQRVVQSNGVLSLRQRSVSDPKTSCRN